LLVWSVSRLLLLLLLLFPLFFLVTYNNHTLLATFCVCSSQSPALRAKVSRVTSPCHLMVTSTPSPKPNPVNPAVHILRDDQHDMLQLVSPTSDHVRHMVEEGYLHKFLPETKRMSPEQETLKALSTFAPSTPVDVFHRPTVVRNIVVSGSSVFPLSPH
jgi:hypothetical protein